MGEGFTVEMRGEVRGEGLGVRDEGREVGAEGMG